MQNLQGLGQKPSHKKALTQRKITDTGMALGWCYGPGMVRPVAGMGLEWCSAIGMVLEWYPKYWTGHGMVLQVWGPGMLSIGLALQWYFRCWNGSKYWNGLGMVLQQILACEWYGNGLGMVLQVLEWS